MSPIRAVPLRLAAMLMAICLVMSIIGCSSDETERKGRSSESGDEVVLVTYDSFALPERAAKAFKSRTGAKIRVVASGDAAEMLTKAMLSAGAPEGDVIFGIDNTLASRAGTSEVLEPVDPSRAGRTDESLRLEGSLGDLLVPIDHGDVCMNLDSSWFESKNLDPPETFEDLASERYADLTVVSSPVTSSPGLAMLAGTVSVFGEKGWQQYWERLRDNGLRVRPSWNDAYYTDYTVSGGDRPIVLSYASSPPAEVVFSEGSLSAPRSTVMEQTCVSQVEYAGLLKGAKHPELGRQLIDFMLSDEWQRELPLSNFVYPAVEVELPEVFVKWAPKIADPLTVPAEEIDRNREKWIESWRTTFE